MYNPASPGGAILSVAIAKYREALADIERLTSSTLEKAYQDRAGDPPAGNPVFTRMIEEYGVADAVEGQATYNWMAAIIIANGPPVNDVTNGAARNAVLSLDAFG